MIKGDDGDKAVEMLLKQTEQEIIKIYDEASKSCYAKLQGHLKVFQRKDAEKRKLVAAGLLSQADYNKWKHGQIMIGQRWQDMVAVLAEDMTNADKIAVSIINDHTPDAYAVNVNYGTYQIEHGLGINTSFTLYDRHTVERLIRDKPDLYPVPKVNVGKDKRWNKQQINNQVLQAILQGEPVKTLAKRIFPEISSKAGAGSTPHKNYVAAMRTARTTLTGAQSAGRVAAYMRAEEMGVQMLQEWVSAHDGHTRESHLDVDGEQVPVGSEFSNECKYPGDPGGPPEEVYNCRCTLVPALKSLGQIKDKDYKPSQREQDIEAYEQDKAAHKMSFETWKEVRGARAQPRPESELKHKIVEGENISRTWKRRADEYAFEIEDVINAQGFDGLPRVVSESEFERYVAESSFIAQRTYSAQDRETLDAYREQLYSGKWYVDCSEGGSQYGKGMYTSSNYSGELTEQIKSDMAHYQAISRMPESYIETFTLDKSAKIITYDDIMREVVGTEDPGVVAVQLGYDAINVEQRGYTIVLNRTKLIIKGD